jgi:hypothetical protein
VFTGSGSLLLHPSEFIESRNDAEAMSSAQIAAVATATRFGESCKPVCSGGRWTVGVALGVARTEYQSRGYGSRSRRDMRALVWPAGSSGGGPPGPAVRLALGGVACAPWVWAGSWCAESEGNGGFRADDLPAAGGGGPMAAVRQASQNGCW